MRRNKQPKRKQRFEPTAIMPTAIYSRRTGAKILGVRVSTFADLVNRGEIQSRKRSNRWFILGQWLLDWVERPDEEKQAA